MKSDSVISDVRPIASVPPSEKRKPMRIGINCRSCLCAQNTGIGRYTAHLIQSLARVDTVNKYGLYVQKNMFDRKRKPPVIAAPNFKVKIDRFRLGTRYTLGSLDIYHSPSPDIFDINGSAKVVVTVHDLVHKAHPEVHTAKTLRMADERFKFVIQRADTIICCSENTRRDLLKYYKVNEKSIQRVYQGVDHKTFYPLRPEEKEEALAVIHANGVSQPFILFVGTIEPRKNLQNLLHAFVELKNRKKFSGQLAVIGMRGWMCDEIEPMVEALGIEKDVVFLGYLSDKELKYFYNLCEAYAYPSLYEGFGFPIVEAFCCGAPVVTSNVSSCPEIAGDAALTADPYNPLAIADALSSIVNDAGLSATLRERALKRAAEFSFDKTAAATLDVYRQTLAF